jgi:hypothetical protein
MILNIISNKINFLNFNMKKPSYLDKTKKDGFSKKCLNFEITVIFYAVIILPMSREAP